MLQLRRRIRLFRRAHTIDGGRATRSVISLSWFCNSNVIKPLIHISASAPPPRDHHCIEVSPRKNAGFVVASRRVQLRRCRGLCGYGGVDVAGVANTHYSIPWCVSHAACVSVLFAGSPERCRRLRAATALDEAAERYRAHLIEDIGRTLVGAQQMRDCMKANDLACAKKAWVEARVGWERSEVFTSGFVPELDQEIDAWPNATRGFHGVEGQAVRRGPRRCGREPASLIARLEELSAQLRTIPLAPQRLLNGIARLAFEVGGNKADGGSRGSAARH